MKYRTCLRILADCGIDREVGERRQIVGFGANTSYLLGGFDGLDVRQG